MDKHSQREPARPLSDQESSMESHPTKHMVRAYTPGNTDLTMELHDSIFAHTLVCTATKVTYI